MIWIHGLAGLTQKLHYTDYWRRGKSDEIAALPVLLSELSLAQVQSGSVLIDSISCEYILVQGKALNSLTGYACLHDGTASFSFHYRGNRLDLGVYGTGLVKVIALRNQVLFTLESFHASEPAMASWWKTHIADIRGCRKQLVS